MARMLVTGGTGFVGSHQILCLLAAGYEVRATVRDARSEGDLRTMLARGGRDPGDRLSVAETDLLSDTGWEAAVDGCDYLFHIASPFPTSDPQDDKQLLAPARDGTRRVLRAACEGGVRRVVLTSSFAAIGYGHRENGRHFTEEDWSDPTGPGVQAYMRSKIAAEREAWNFVAQEGRKMELAVVNPVGIFGPTLGPRISSSLSLVLSLMQGIPVVPRIYFGAVDVRDLVELQLKAMLAPEAAGERFMAVADPRLSLMDVSRILREELGQEAERVPTRQSPDWLIRALGLFNQPLRAVVPQLGRVRLASSEKAQEMLGWRARPVRETFTDTGLSLLEWPSLFEQR